MAEEIDEKMPMKISDAGLAALKDGEGLSNMMVLILEVMKQCPKACLADVKRHIIVLMEIYGSEQTAIAAIRRGDAVFKATN